MCLAVLNSKRSNIVELLIVIFAIRYIAHNAPRYNHCFCFPLE